MATFVLVHGGHAGGWQWREVAAGLEAAGHTALRPTLTGLGERAHLAGPGVGLDTHLRDVLNVLAYEELHEVILAGHSYGGLVITGVAERAPERLRHLVYLDAFVPRDGESLRDLLAAALGPAAVAQVEAQVRGAGGGWRLPRPPADSDGAPNPRATDQPYATFTQPVAVRSPAAAALPRTYVLCTERPPGWPFAPVLAAAAARARASGWGYHELPTGHALWRTAPREVETGTNRGLPGREVPVPAGTPPPAGPLLVPHRQPHERLAGGGRVAPGLSRSRRWPRRSAPGAGRARARPGAARPARPW
jgi:pimeloyl-ACP methyl ester carboxylesterase